MELLNRMQGEMKKFEQLKITIRKLVKSLISRKGQSKERIEVLKIKETKPTTNPIHQNLQASSTTLPPNSLILLQSPWNFEIQFAPILRRLKR